jgi:selenocysteine lyase/cysteine desulfurase
MLGIGFIFFYINPVTKISPKTNLLIFEGVSLVIGFRSPIVKVVGLGPRDRR